MHYEPATEMDRDEGLTWEEAEWNRQHDRFYDMKRHVAVEETLKLLRKLWLLEQALNVVDDQRFRLPKGWDRGDHFTVAKHGAEVFIAHYQRGITLRQMEDAYGKADDIHTEILALKAEYEELARKANVVPTFSLPKGFRSLNPYQLQELLESAAGCVEYARKRVNERLRAQERATAEAEIRAQHELEMKRINDERNARRDLRKAELDAILRPYTETAMKLLEHPVFRTVSIKLPKLGLDPFTVAYHLGSLDEEGYQILLNKARAEITTNQRKLREPMRRAHQSAQSRGITKLGFEDYLRKEGFEHLLK